MWARLPEEEIRPRVMELLLLLLILAMLRWTTLILQPPRAMQGQTQTVTVKGRRMLQRMEVRMVVTLRLPC